MSPPPAVSSGELRARAASIEADLVALNERRQSLSYAALAETNAAAREQLEQVELSIDAKTNELDQVRIAIGEAERREAAARSLLRDALIAELDAQLLGLGRVRDEAIERAMMAYAEVEECIVTVDLETRRFVRLARTLQDLTGNPAYANQAALVGPTRNRGRGPIEFDSSSFAFNRRIDMRTTSLEHHAGEDEWRSVERRIRALTSPPPALAEHERAEAVFVAKQIAAVHSERAPELLATLGKDAALDVVEAAERANLHHPGGRDEVLAAIQERRAALVPAGAAPGENACSAA